MVMAVDGGVMPLARATVLTLSYPSHDLTVSIKVKYKYCTEDAC